MMPTIYEKKGVTLMYVTGREDSIISYGKFVVRRSCLTEMHSFALNVLWGGLALA